MNFSMILNKLTNDSRPVFSKLATKPAAKFKLLAWGMATCLLVTGCGNTDSNTSDANALSKQNSANQSAAEDEAMRVHQQQVAESTAIGGEPQGKPVSYDVHSWKVNKNKKIALEDLEQMKKVFGKVTVTDKNSLDYASNSAVKYRFMNGNEPYLDIIDSNKYLEFGWYYANPNDTDSEKKKSVSHAKKMYTVANALMGEEGGELVANMLAGQVVKDKMVAEQRIEVAKCEFYSCMLIIDKNP